MYWSRSTGKLILKILINLIEILIILYWLFNFVAQRNSITWIRVILWITITILLWNFKHKIYNIYLFETKNIFQLHFVISAVDLFLSDTEMFLLSTFTSDSITNKRVGVNYSNCDNSKKDFDTFLTTTRHCRAVVIFLQQ